MRSLTLRNDLSVALALSTATCRGRLHPSSPFGQAFAAGADINEDADKSYIIFSARLRPPDYERSRACARVIARLRVFARCGCELAMMCDFIIGRYHGQFRAPEIKLGRSSRASARDQLLARSGGKAKPWT